MTEGRRFKQTMSLKERLISFAHEARDEAVALRPGAEQEDLLKARQADTAARIAHCVNSAGLQPPK
jgi:hypothetical protein